MHTGTVFKIFSPMHKVLTYLGMPVDPTGTYYSYS